LLLPLAALLVAGCGGGGGDDSTESTAVSTVAPTALTKAELIEQGDAICAEVNAAAATETNGEESSALASTGLADLYSGMVASLNNLGTPQESAGYAEFSSAAEELAKAEGEVKLAAEREDTAALEGAESTAASALATFQEAAGDYGFEECSEGPAPIATPQEAGGAEAGGIEEGGEEAAPEALEPEAAPEAAPEAVPETGGGAGAVEGGGSGAPEAGGESGGSSGGIGPG
jgi:hypothetical protein